MGEKSRGGTASHQFVDELIADPQQLLRRLVEIFGAEHLAQMVYSYDLLKRENGYGGIEVVFSDSRPQNVKAVISLR